MSENFTKYPFIIYGKQNCPNCDFIKNLCIEHNKTFEYKELDKDFKREDFENFFKVVDKKVYPVLSYNGIQISFYLFLKVYLQEFLNTTKTETEALISTITRGV